jgi:hypothetical protein
VTSFSFDKQTFFLRSTFVLESEDKERFGVFLHKLECKTMEKRTQNPFSFVIFNNSPGAFSGKEMIEPCLVISMIKC